MPLTATPLDPSRRGDEVLELQAELSGQLVGQREAIDSVVQACQLQGMELNDPGRPLGSFLFLGPTGVGKTRLVEVLAQTLHKSPTSLLKVDCAEFQHGHEIAKLIGSPPGYLGHQETNALLTQERLTQVQSANYPVSLILFDEIEKASNTLWNLLLGILDKATLTLGNNRRVLFNQSMIFMTSNLGAKEIARVAEARVGFSPPAVSRTKDTDKLALSAARRAFTPEFINRIDHTVVFHPLGSEELEQVFHLELGRVNQRFVSAATRRGGPPLFILRVSDEARRWIIADGSDARYGARHLKRSIERNLVLPVTNLLSSHQIHEHDVIQVGVDSEHLEFSRI